MEAPAARDSGNHDGCQKDYAPALDRRALTRFQPVPRMKDGARTVPRRQGMCLSATCAKRGVRLKTQ